uniref:Integrase n=1 Tax=Siphoviridae sp. ctnFo11 TaxID=2826454 RepID=A0A8S5N5P0_9CAUD|nr:MAG TPA: SITE SPECIFIC RECOMBINASE XERD [Siphoviridae sp. ctnFo11]
MEEKFRVELLMMLDKSMSKELVSVVDMALTALFQKYDVSEACTDLAVCDDSNERIINTYIASMRLEGRSEKTLKQYYDALTKLLDEIPKSIKDIRTNDIRYHLAHYQGTHKVSNATVNNKRKFLSAFFVWATREEIVEKNPMLKINSIKEKYVTKKPFSDIEIAKIRDALEDNREKALVEFLLSTGCRVSEVAGLKVGNIDFRTGECVVLGKGNKERTVYLNNKSMYYLERYLGNFVDAERPLFMNARGRGMTKQNIEELMRIIGKRAGVSKVHPHRFRRTMATNAMKRGMPVQYIQVILGHSKLDTTMIYCIYDKEVVKAEYLKVA